GRVPGVADDTDLLPAGDPGAGRVHAGRGHVCIPRDVTAGMLDIGVVAVAAVGGPGLDHSAVGGHDRRAAPAADVDAVVRTVVSPTAVADLRLDVARGRIHHLIVD